LPEELEGLLRRLRLPYVRRLAPEVLATAKAQRWEPAEILRVLLTEEAAGRDRATIQTRRGASALPTGKTFDAWEQSTSAIPKATVVGKKLLSHANKHHPISAKLILSVKGGKATTKAGPGRLKEQRRGALMT
jgi:DNA replication protein DnaC